MASCSGRKSKVDPKTKSKVDQILDAASAGNLRRIRKMVKEFTDGKIISEAIAKIKDSDGRGVLHAAAVKGRANICKYFLEELKLNVDEKDSEDCTPLLHASLEGHLSTVEYLIEHGADPRALNNHNTTALHLATLEGHIDVMHLLLSKGADVNALSDIGTPLQVAAQLCKPDTLKMLLDHGADPNLVSLIPSPLDFSLSRSLECTKLLIQAGADPNGRSWGMRPLASAAKEGKSELIKCLLDAGADPNITNDIGLKPIEIAARNENNQEVEILFPVTSPIPSCSDWSITGIMKHVRSEEFIQQITLKVKEMHLKAKSNGEDALKRQDYSQAAFYYTEAIAADPSDATVLSSRSLCFACLGNGGSAWSDAKACIMLKPDWPEAYYRAGIALSLIEKYDMATDVFLMGLKLDPENKNLKDAIKNMVIPT
ncbi:Ankyrin repeat domain-containing protein [Thalictrum thalictroides]|uniref:Ankyrin repeat domain-containing protein n=1 Tax=Thalictrum thalictroides TaxID=46969 RepID=A0A7J6WIH2_THATH|nr:Ankyrin repeat domain-containing protein [Thalictrum thalictroides]